MAPRHPTPSLLRPSRGRLACAIGVASLLGILAPACGGGPPGTVLGTYQVLAKGEANTCGSGLGAPIEYEFDVELSQLDGTLYWSWLDNSPLASGRLTPVSSTDAQLEASLYVTQSENVDPTDAGAGPCTMARSDSMLVTLAKGSPPGSFTGTMSYTFTVPFGSDCADQLVAAGGMYSALPCTVSYTIGGTRQ
jgi:hypothetical protein